MSTKTKTILVFLILFLSIFVYLFFRGVVYKDRFRDAQINAVVIKRDNWQKRATEFYLSDGFRIDSTYSKKFDIKVGDSIVKQAGSFEFQVYRKNTKAEYLHVHTFTLKKQ